MRTEISNDEGVSVLPAAEVGAVSPNAATKELSEMKALWALGPVDAENPEIRGNNPTQLINLVGNSSFPTLLVNVELGRRNCLLQVDNIHDYLQLLMMNTPPSLLKTSNLIGYYRITGPINIFLSSP